MELRLTTAGMRMVVALLAGCSTSKSLDISSWWRMQTKEISITRAQVDPTDLHAATLLIKAGAQ
jgi:hypothetical protein